MLLPIASLELPLVRYRQSNFGDGSNKAYSGHMSEATIARFIGYWGSIDWRRPIRTLTERNF
jgi:hypothetical protein